MEVEEYKGSKILFTSSHLFLFSSLFGFYIGNWKISIGMLIVYLTSIYYHYEGGKERKMIDMMSNIILGFYYSIQLYKEKIYIPGIIGLLVIGMYIGVKKIEEYRENNVMIDIRSSNSHPNTSYSTSNVEMNHLIFVHIPIYLGFMYIHYLYLMIL